MEDQQPLVLPIPDALSWVYQALALGITTGKCNGQKGETSRGGISKTSLIIDSGSSINIKYSQSGTSNKNTLWRHLMG